MATAWAKYDDAAVAMVTRCHGDALPRRHTATLTRCYGGTVPYVHVPVCGGGAEMETKRMETKRMETKGMMHAPVCDDGAEDER